MGISRKSRLSQDLTILLMRGNGSPRAFRIRVPALVRSLVSLSGVLFGLSLFAILSLLWIFVFPKSIALPKIEMPQIVSPSPSPVAQTSTDTVEGDQIPASDASFKEELQKLQAQLEDRKKLPTKSQISLTTAENIQFFGPNSSVIPSDQVFLQLKNIRANVSGNRAELNFDLQNVHPSQQQVRGYIVVLAKGAHALFTYPSQVLSPKDNILLNYGKGETFAVSRYRQAQAKFENLPADIGPLSYQILLFQPDGHLILSSHVEGN